MPEVVLYGTDGAGKSATANVLVGLHLLPVGGTPHRRRHIKVSHHDHVPGGHATVLWPESHNPASISVTAAREALTTRGHDVQLLLRVPEYIRRRFGKGSEMTIREVPFAGAFPGPGATKPLAVFLVDGTQTDRGKLEELSAAATAHRHGGGQTLFFLTKSDVFHLESKPDAALAEATDNFRKILLSKGHPSAEIVPFSPLMALWADRLKGVERESSGSEDVYRVVPPLAVLAASHRLMDAMPRHPGQWSARQRKSVAEAMHRKANTRFVNNVIRKAMLLA